MKKYIHHWALCVVFLFPISALASYGWIPKYQTLIMSLGYEHFQSSENFDQSATRVDLSYQNQLVELTDRIIRLNAEYGITESWSATLDLSYMNSSLDPDSGGDALLSGAGFGDIITSVKWAVKPVTPIVTLEAMFRFPTAISSPIANDELVLGDGTFDFGFLIHSGFKSGRIRFSLSPGILVRFGGYSTAVLVKTGAEYLFPRGYVGFRGKFIYSFSDPILFDSSETSHDAAGTGGSYARLNGGPVGVEAGAAVGFRAYKRKLWLELSFDHALFGNKYPNFSRVGFTVTSLFDFFKPSTATKTREVPFDFDYDKFDRGTEKPAEEN